MDAKVEIIAAGTYEDALKAGQDAAGKLAKGAKDIKIKARRLKAAGQWKVILTYKRDIDTSKPFDVNEFFNTLNRNEDHDSKDDLLL